MAAQDPSLTEAHRQFAQALLALGAVEAGLARGILRRCCERHRVHCAPERLDEFVAALNARLQPLSLEIRKGLAEEDGRAFYAMVNLAENEVTKLASDYSESELELFKKTLDLILSSESGFASSTAILNSADQVKPKKMRKTEAEQVLQSLVQGKWLQEREGEYTLTVRSILELEQYILSHYPESARKCHICRSLSIQVRWAAGGQGVRGRKGKEDGALGMEPAVAVHLSRPLHTHTPRLKAGGRPQPLPLPRLPPSAPLEGHTPPLRLPSWPLLSTSWTETHPEGSSEAPGTQCKQPTDRLSGPFLPPEPSVWGLWDRHAPALPGQVLPRPTRTSLSTLQTVLASPASRPEAAGTPAVPGPPAGEQKDFYSSPAAAIKRPAASGHALMDSFHGPSWTVGTTIAVQFLNSKA